jgi:D-alanyl-D-alanine dipeptidase
MDGSFSATTLRVDMVFDIRGEKFDVKFVNNYVRERYNDMLQLVDELTDLPEEVEEITSEDRAEMRRGFRDIRKRQRAITKDITEIRRDMLNEILTTNGYEYDSEWWRRKTDVEDINTFVFDCIQKDVKSDGKQSKKK